MLVFNSGFGDGLYPRYVGFNEKREVVKFITDFIEIEWA